LRGEAMGGIVRLKLNGIGQRLMKSHKIRFTYDDQVVDQIAQRCTEVETGARNIDHILNGSLLPRISVEILERMTEGLIPEALDLRLDENGEFDLQFKLAEESGPVSPAESEVTVES
jgi:type VI secretion system protein VasG